MYKETCEITKYLKKPLEDITGKNDPPRNVEMNFYGKNVQRKEELNSMNFKNINHEARSSQSSKLRNNTKFSNSHFHPRLKNISDINFSKDILQLLNYGLKYSIPKDLSLKDLESLSIETDIVIQNLSRLFSNNNSLRNSYFKS
ncbi:uncharacterized protein LOC114345218 [Diabrotica virgifera virgifera]|uniref:Uncharacterized protein LOC114345218 n=1 Tax=Diabrotica virgifera virgifera TaxID=50390 RepID=A0A6P7H2B2_DIAVI|nr:uncharacterized protein LOC114345218 [Diabrotica virgifera virgifera]XP_028151850.1 uncharacterized protein LOC114345218 [Diabrotica virgifera virgifera]